jgi:hypothetical protein
MIGIFINSFLIMRAVEALIDCKHGAPLSLIIKKEEMSPLNAEGDRTTRLIEKPSPFESSLHDEVSASTVLTLFFILPQ